MTIGANQNDGVVDPSLSQEGEVNPAVTSGADSLPSANADQEPVTDPAVEPPKTFTKEELEAELARERRKWEREQEAQKALPPELEVPTDPITPDQFETPEEYAEALAVRKAAEIVRDRENARRASEINMTFAEREEKAREKYPDYDQVARRNDLAINQTMAQIIKSSEKGAEMAYYLGSNPDEAYRIFQMSPVQQAMEMGKIEAKVSAGHSPTPVRKASSAPDPINPVVSNTSSAPVYDTTDPRSTTVMTTSEWIEADRRRQIRNMQARNR